MVVSSCKMVRFRGLGGSQRAMSQESQRSQEEPGGSKVVVFTFKIGRFRGLGGPKRSIPFWDPGEPAEPGGARRVQSGRFYVQNGVVLEVWAAPSAQSDSGIQESQRSQEEPGGSKVVVFTFKMVRFRGLDGPRCSIPFSSRGNHEEPGTTRRVQSARFYVHSGPF